MREALTVKEAAVELNISPGLAYRLIAKGDLPAIRLGEKKLIVPRKAIEKILNGWRE